jgi:type I restriction enzyme S subunit
MKPYPKYKDSGVEWLGEVPDNWDVSVIKRFTETITDGAHISPETDGGVYPFVSTKDVFAESIDFENCLRTSEESFEVMVKTGCQPFVGDVLFSKDGTIGRTVVVRETRDFVVASSLIIIRPKKGCLDSNFFNRICQSNFFIGQVESLVKGAGLPRLSIQNLLKVVSCFPPVSEQTVIAAFLDRKAAEIDRLIANKERLIELYEEEKTAVINQAVTRGLHPDAPMKPSGIDWLGDVPEHWEVKRLRYIVKNLESGVSVNATDLPASEEDFGVLKTSCVYAYTFNPEENKAIWPEELARAKINPRKGEIIISRMNTPELVGASGYVHQDYPNLFLPDRLWQTIFYDYGVIDTFWFSFILKCSKFRELVSITATGTSPSMKNLAQEAFLYISIPFPKKDEQAAITEHIETECSRLEIIIEKFKKQIDLLKEYRTTLISEVVTGKIDVRDEVVQ